MKQPDEKKPIPKDVVNAVLGYVYELDKSYGVDMAYLFGSYAKGTFHDESDIDVFIVSDNFNEYTPFQVSMKYDKRISTEFRRTQFHDTENGGTKYVDPTLGDVSQEILRTGICIDLEWLRSLNAETLKDPKIIEEWLLLQGQKQTEQDDDSLNGSEKRRSMLSVITRILKLDKEST
jgi:predicted nucleotidyltransferase